MKLLRRSKIFQRLYDCQLKRFICRNMSSLDKTNHNHLQRTAENTRNETTSTATVVELRQESETVKSLWLKVHNKQVTFKAGQWIDMFIPGVETVGGFSMCSSPLRLQETQLLELAVKYSKHPPAYWIHTECKEGSEVALRVGGDFFYDPATQGDQDLLLIAGGVGINPLYSIINHVTEINIKGGNSDDSISNTSLQRVMLLYSAKTEEELIFKTQLDSIQLKDRQVQCQYFVTRDNIGQKSTNQVAGQRIGVNDISRCFDWLRKDHVSAYLCGPSPMLTDMEKLLLEQGVSKTKIHYEKWW